MHHFNTKTPQITVCCKTSYMILSILPFICKKFSKLILRKFIKIVAKRRQILRPKCTKFDVGRGSASDSAGAPPQTPLGELTALPRPLAGSKGPYLILRIERMGGEGKGRTPPRKKTWLQAWLQCNWFILLFQFVV